jgi:hypothetical protein
VDGEEHVLDNVLGAIRPPEALADDGADEGSDGNQEQAIGCGVTLLGGAQQFAPSLVRRFPAVARQKILRVGRV